MRSGLLPTLAVGLLWSTFWPALAPAGSSEALRYLASLQDRYHQAFYVYSDADSAGNHFHVRGRMGDGEVPPMQEDFSAGLCRSLTCIRAEFDPSKASWGGWYFLNGVLGPEDRAPRLNWGEEPGAGIDLSGATRLTFLARGERGGEQVEFFCAGVGRDPFSGRPRVPYPGSSPRISTGRLTLSHDWREFRLDLRGRDLSYVLGGFGWVAAGSLLDRVVSRQPIVFYLDEIQYDKPRLQEPRFLLSYETARSADPFDRVMRNVAFVYDNAVALIAFLGAGELQRARWIAEALVYAMEHDRFYDDGRIRNAYQAGDLQVPPGWAPNGRRAVTRLPGYWETGAGEWREDAHQVGTDTGNAAWAMLALLAMYEATGEARWLQAASRLGEWVEKHCRDKRGAAGYTAGYRGWEPNPEPLAYKSTEHNIDLCAAFLRLHRATDRPQWQESAGHAARFVASMWDPGEGKFWAGVLDDGVTINRRVIPLDVQAWALLAFGPAGFPGASPVPAQQLMQALRFAGGRLAAGGGYDYNEDRDGVWYEGTAQMALAYRVAGDESKAQALLSFLRSRQLRTGALLAAEPERLTTGFGWYYYRRPHTGATAWYILAELGLNPFSSFPPPGSAARPFARLCPPPHARTLKWITLGVQ